MKTALVLSGGGAKGAFQAAVVDTLERAGLTWSVVAGISVGALNGALIAQEKTGELLELWERLDRERVFRGARFGIGTAWRLWRRLALYDTAPLARLLEEYIVATPFARPFTGSATILETGESYTFTDSAHVADLRALVLASAAIPIAFPPVRIQIRGQDGVRHFVDGGVRDMTPLRSVIDWYPDRVLVVHCNPSTLAPSPAPRRAHEVASRALEIMLNEIARNDVERARTVNRFVGWTKKVAAHYVRLDVHELEPPEELGDSLDFGAEARRRRIVAGVDVARAWLAEHGDDYES